MGNPVETECCHPEAEAWRNYVFEQGVTSLRISPAEGGKWRWLLLAAWFVWIVSATGAWQEGPPTHPHGAPQPTEAARRGRDQFLKTCAFCHGPDANGGSAGPNLLRSAVVRHDENGNLIGEVVRDGRPDKGMPAFQLSASQIQDIAAFLHFRILQSDRASPLRPGANFADAKVLIGNAEAGKAFFFGKGKCAECHSPTGDLAGIARRYPAVELQARFLYPPDQHPTAVVTDASGHRFTGTIRLLTAFDVAIQGEDGWYRSWPVSKVKLTVHDKLAAHRQLLSVYTDSDTHNILMYLETLK